MRRKRLTSTNSPCCTVWVVCEREREFAPAIVPRELHTNR